MSDDGTEDYEHDVENPATDDDTDNFQHSGDGSDAEIETNSPPVNNTPATADDDAQLANRGNFVDDDEYTSPRPKDTATGKKGAAAAGDDTQSTEEEDENLNKPVLGTKGKMMDEEEKEKKESRRKVAALLGVIAAFIVLLALLIFFFKPNEGGTARAQLGDNETTAPTWSPTESTDAPTSFPTTPKPTPAIGTPTWAPSPQPTYSPTAPFTFAPHGETEISRLPCDEIKVQENVTEGNFGDNNFKLYPYNNVEVCADTWGGTDPAHPNRNQWSVKLGRRDCPALGYHAGWTVCDFVGARWCTIDELTQLVGQGTGCGGDRVFVYSNTDCTNNGVAGKYMFNLGLSDSRQPFFKCETDMTSPSVIRCCGDNY